MAWLLILRGGGAKTRRRQRRSRTRTERKAAKRSSCGQPAPLQHRRAARAASAQLYHAAARVARGRYTRRAARESRRPPTSLPRPRRAVHAPPYARATHLEKWAKELEGRRWTGKGGREASKREPPEVPGFRRTASGPQPLPAVRGFRTRRTSRLRRIRAGSPAATSCRRPFWVRAAATWPDIRRFAAKRRSEQRARCSTHFGPAQQLKCTLPPRPPLALLTCFAPAAAWLAPGSAWCGGWR